MDNDCNMDSDCSTDKEMGELCSDNEIDGSISFHIQTAVKNTLQWSELLSIKWKLYNYLKTV